LVLAGQALFAEALWQPLAATLGSMAQQILRLFQQQRALSQKAGLLETAQLLGQQRSLVLLADKRLLGLGLLVLYIAAGLLAVLFLELTKAAQVGVAQAAHMAQAETAARQRLTEAPRVRAVAVEAAALRAATLGQLITHLQAVTTI
jgi:hypothetical protein